MQPAVSREAWIGIVVSAIAVAAMAVDHLMGQDPGLEDLPTFLLSSGLTLGLAAVVFGFVVPRGKGSAERAARRGLVCSGLAVLLLVFTLWLGLPFALAGGGVALGLAGLGGTRRRRAWAAVALGALVLLVGVSVYIEEAIRKTV